MGGNDAAAAGCCNLITYFVLLVFTSVSFGTYGWAFAAYEISFEGADCSTNVDWYVGLNQQYQSYDNGCTGEDSSDISEFNCDNLSDDQCNFLTEARDSAAVAITCCVFLVIIYGMVMMGVRSPGGRAMYFLVGAAIIAGVVMISTAFAASSAYQNLIDDINDKTGEFELSSGFSLHLMITSGVFGILAIGCSVATIYFYRMQGQSSEELTATLTNSKSEQDRPDQL